MTTGDMLHFTQRLKKYEVIEDKALKDEYLANLQRDIESIYGEDTLDTHVVAIHQAVVEARSDF